MTLNSAVTVLGRSEMRRECKNRLCAFETKTPWAKWQMSRYHFYIVDDYDICRKLLTAELDNYEEVIERAELLACLLSSAGLDWYESGEETRKIRVVDDADNDILVVRLSDGIPNNLEN